MPRRVELPVSLKGAPFLTRDAAEEGLSRERLRSRDVAHPFHGVNVLAHPTSVDERCNALAPLLRPDDAFSHRTAATLLGAPLPRARDSSIHVTSGESNRMRRPGVIGHRAADLPRILHLGLPIVEPSHVWFQLATQLGHDDLVAVGDYLVTPDRHRRTPALASLNDLRAAIPERARGAARARSALADVRVGAESRMETLLRLLLTRTGLPEPLLNPPLRTGDQTLHPDLLFDRWRVVIEYEGDQHRTDERQWMRDIRRREAFEDAGWRVIRVTRYDVLMEPEALLARVCRTFAQRSGTLDPHPGYGGRLSE